MRASRHVVLWLSIVALLASGLLSATYPRQVRAYLTNWKGSPRSTIAYVAPSATAAPG